MPRHCCIGVRSCVGNLLRVANGVVGIVGVAIDGDHILGALHGHLKYGATAYLDIVAVIITERGSVG